MKRTPLRRSRKPLTRTAIKRKTRVKPRNAKRRATEFVRCYHSKARVVWIKSRPCMACSALSPLFGMETIGRCHNAHTVSGGKGRKAGYETIVPFCPSHHKRYDEHQAPFDKPAARDAAKEHAIAVQRAWLASQGESA